MNVMACRRVYFVLSLGARAPRKHSIIYMENMHLIYMRQTTLARMNE